MADYWLKLYIEILDDPKMATLPDRVWRRAIELFLVAKRLNKDGHLPDTRQIAWMLRMAPDELEHDLRQIAGTGIITQEVGGWFIPKFVARQAAVGDAERKRQERERKQSQQYYGTVTEQSRIVTQRQKTEAEAETEADAEAPANTDFSKLSAFIATLLKVPEFSGGPVVWIKGVQDLLDANCTQEDVRTALDLAMNGTKEYTIVGPQSLKTFAINARMKREHKSNGHKDGQPAGMVQAADGHWEPRI